MPVTEYPTYLKSGDRFIAVICGKNFGGEAALSSSVSEVTLKSHLPCFCPCASSLFSDLSAAFWVR
eukprot:1029686-Amphidinium_carterae.1